MTQSPQSNPENAPLRSIHTSNFPQILNHFGISLVVSTYQAGKLIALRADGNVINTHFRVFNKPMGLAGDQNRLAIGTNSQILQLKNVPAVAAKIEPQGKHDACYLLRSCQVTGDIDIHEMAWANDELWFVNTRFSCLCTLDPEYSFVPRWRPKFVTAYSPEDRCHLNGLGMVDNQPKYVTALGTTDILNGWREKKANGGVLIDVETQELITQGLSMPHSPRWYNGHLWVLESGNGSLAKVDRNTGKLETIATLPGFTRGIDFCGKLAFIGLSQVRETVVFSGIPLTERLTERTCGVWVINIETGETLAFLKFEDAVQEIFAVQILQGIRFPEIIDWDEQLIASSYVLPDQALAEVPTHQKQIISEKPKKSKKGFG
ncbi:TIGR03032 family protein [Aphanothece hegewaldii CCALA 016]|uniref:TIGR03032 family protein n=1 Tax=Aphanothece hegewaldii CCALA 016 TaxID=2107694 RepID=A0A2T1LSG3_9CHRO|nr:TIGR03032 family protein [Aphanothece hegewaldii]PSF32485.1 TIGR03032 family protein [Aphanothece hegewaldii CCALA 016]